jgi:hypothetical protein
LDNAEKVGTIAPEQFGSRKKNSSINHAINKQLTVDILQQDRKSYSLISLDAKGCYDQIAQPVAATAMKRKRANSQNEVGNV